MKRAFCLLFLAVLINSLNGFINIGDIDGFDFLPPNPENLMEDMLGIRNNLRPEDIMNEKRIDDGDYFEQLRRNDREEDIQHEENLVKLWDELLKNKESSNDQEKPVYERGYPLEENERSVKKITTEEGSGLTDSEQEAEKLLDQLFTKNGELRQKYDNKPQKVKLSIQLNSDDLMKQHKNVLPGNAKDRRIDSLKLDFKGQPMVRFNSRPSLDEMKKSVMNSQIPSPLNIFMSLMDSVPSDVNVQRSMLDLQPETENVMVINSHVIQDLPAPMDMSLDGLLNMAEQIMNPVVQQTTGNMVMTMMSPNMPQELNLDGLLNMGMNGLMGVQEPRTSQYHNKLLQNLLPRTIYGSIDMNDKILKTKETYLNGNQIRKEEIFVPKEMNNILPETVLIGDNNVMREIIARQEKAEKDKKADELLDRLEKRLREKFLKFVEDVLDDKNSRNEEKEDDLKEDEIIEKIIYINTNDLNDLENKNVDLTDSEIYKQLRNPDNKMTVEHLLKSVPFLANSASDYDSFQDLLKTNKMENLLEEKKDEDEEEEEIVYIFENPSGHYDSLTEGDLYIELASSLENDDKAYELIKVLACISRIPLKLFQDINVSDKIILFRVNQPGFKANAFIDKIMKCRFKIALMKRMAIKDMGLIWNSKKIQIEYTKEEENKMKGEDEVNIADSKAVSFLEEIEEEASKVNVLLILICVFVPIILGISLAIGICLLRKRSRVVDDEESLLKEEERQDKESGLPKRSIRSFIKPLMKRDNKRTDEE